MTFQWIYREGWILPALYVDRQICVYFYQYIFMHIYRFRYMNYISSNPFVISQLKALVIVLPTFSSISFFIRFFSCYKRARVHTYIHTYIQTLHLARLLAWLCRPLFFFFVPHFVMFFIYLPILQCAIIVRPSISMYSNTK